MADSKPIVIIEIVCDVLGTRLIGLGTGYREAEADAQKVFSKWAESSLTNPALSLFNSNANLDGFVPSLVEAGFDVNITSQQVP